MTILVTGGAGFIASHIVDAYIAAGYRVVVVDNLSSGQRQFVNTAAVFYAADICNSQEIESVFSREMPEIITHHAAQISVRNSVADPVFDARVNIQGLLHVLEAGRKGKVKKVIFASSGGGIYGEVDQYPTSETYHPLSPLSPYGITKLCGETYLSFYRKTYGLPFVALRYGNVYGPRQNPHGEAGVVAIFSKTLLRQETPVIYGDGLQTRDYIFVGDIVEANVKALSSDFSGSVNIGTGKETSVVALLSALQGFLHTSISPRYETVRAGEQRRSYLDVSLAQRVLDWVPKTSLRDGLEKTVQYFRGI